MISFSFINFLNGIIFSLHPITIVASGINSSVGGREGGGRRRRGEEERTEANGRRASPLRGGRKKLIFLMQHYLRNEVSAEIAK